MVQPCCGSSLKQGTKFLAVFSMVLSVMGIVLSALYLKVIIQANLGSGSDLNHDDDELFPANEGGDFCIDSIIPEPLMVLLILVFCVMNLFLAIILLLGTEQENYLVCQFWWRISFVLCLIDIVFLIWSVAVCTANITDIVINSAEILRSIYELWVVKAFMQELQKPEEIACRAVRTNSHNPSEAAA